jgi:hypothetical protein
MEGLGVAASVIAVVDLSAKVAQWCIQYSREVKDAKDDILRMHKEVQNLGNVASDVQHLITRPDRAELSTSEKLRDAIDNCSAQLKTLERTLDPGKARKAMRRFGYRALKWPFQSRQVEKVIKDLERCKGTISLALQVDQTYVLVVLNQK